MTQKGLRDQYWALHSLVDQGCHTQPEIRSLNISPLSHIRHCIDLLRNSIMCTPDLTVETKNKELGGVTGFGTEHECKDWGQLLSWVSEWENHHPAEDNV